MSPIKAFGLYGTGFIVYRPSGCQSVTAADAIWEMLLLDRRIFVAATAMSIATRALGVRVSADARFPPNFLWGAATAAHQVEGNNVNSDDWVMEHVRPSTYLVKHMGLNSYRFSLEWARIEPEPGMFSIAMLDHYKMMIEGCRTRGLTPLVTFNHFTTPRWFAASAGWTNPQSPALFARFCERAARHLAGSIGYATTLNEPNFFGMLPLVLPPDVVNKLLPTDRAMSEAAARANGVAKFIAGDAFLVDDVAGMQANLLAAHRAGREAIKSVRPDLPVGVSLAIVDDQSVGVDSLRDAMRAKLYGAWLDAARGDDFVGVQNYERAVWNDKGKVIMPADVHDDFGSEIYPPSLAGAVRYAHAASGIPIIVTEHGLNAADDRLRVQLIPTALRQLKKAIDQKVPVLGYMHWSLVDNFEWSLGYGPKYGLHSLDRTTFARTPKPSAALLGAIARDNSLRSAGSS